MTLPKEEFCTRVGFRVRELRLEKQLTIEKLALDTGIEYTQLSRIELGRINTSIYQIYRISKTLDIPIQQIFTGVS